MRLLVICSAVHLDGVMKKDFAIMHGINSHFLLYAVLSADKAVKT